MSCRSCRGFTQASKYELVKRWSKSALHISGSGLCCFAMASRRPIVWPAWFSRRRARLSTRPGQRASGSGRGGGQGGLRGENEARIPARKIARRAAGARADPAEALERHHIFSERHSAFKRGETRPRRAGLGDTCVSTGATKTPDRGRGGTERPRQRLTRDHRTASVAARRTERSREAVPLGSLAA
jgi:hypothetical protein